MEVYLARERQERWFDSMVPALCGGRSWEKLFDLLEATPFLARQAELSRGFLRGSDTLERHVLPALVELGDWERFLRYAATAVNFRGLAESLAEGEVLHALAANGQADWAVSLAEQIPDPAQRWRCRIVVTAALPADDSRYHRLLREVAAGLEGVELRDRATAEDWCTELEEGARALGIALRSSWKAWTDRLADWPDLADRARRAAAESLFEAGAPEDRRLWELLAGITSADVLASFLPRRLAEAAPGDCEPLLDRVRSLPAGGERLAWLARVAILGRRAESDPSGAREAWLRAAAGASVPWSVELAEVGVGLWPRFSDQDIDALAAGVVDPTCRAALRVLALDRSCSSGRAAAALEALPAMPPGPEQLHWTLRCLAGIPTEPISEHRRRVGIVLERLHLLRYRVPDEDLCRALGLASEVFPKDLRRRVEDVLWSSAGSTGTLLALVERAESVDLLRELFERAESYAAAVASSQAEGFELRRRVLVRLACRLCRIEASLQPAERAAGRLLPEEEDELLLKVAAGLSPEQPDLAGEAARRIRSPALQLRALLSVLSPGAELNRRLRPESLYRAAATVDALEDELRALSALRESPVRPEELAQRHLEGIRRPSRRIEALIDLAWHALRYQERTFPSARRDLLAAILPLKQALGVVESDTWLLGITPELAEVGAELGLGNAVAELQEAADRIVRLDSVPWPKRAEALRTLIARVQPVLLGGGPAGAERYGAAANLLDWLADLPERAEPGPGRDELRQHWHEVFPWLIAAVRRMPAEVRAFLAHPVQARLSWYLGRFAPQLPGRFRSRWSEERLDSFLAGWDWLSPHQIPALEAGFASRDELLGHARSLLESGDPDPVMARALAGLLGCEASEVVPELVRGLPAEERASLGWSLLRHAWLPPDVSRHLVEAISEQSRSWGQVWLGLGLPAAVEKAAWSHALAELVGDSALGPEDPAALPIRRRLRVLEEGGTLQALGTAAVEALRSGGKRGGESALCLFLNAYLPPRPDETAAAAIRSSLTLPSGNGSDFQESARERRNEGVTALGRIREVRRRWKKSPRDKVVAQALNWLPEEDFNFVASIPALLIGFMAAVYLLLLQGFHEPYPGPPPGWIANAGLLLVCACNAWLIGRFLARSTPEGVRPRKGLVPLRTALAAIPCLGLFLLPLAWRWLLVRRPEWAFDSSPREMPEAANLAWQVSDKVLVALTIGNFAGSFLWFQWLGAEEMTPVRRAQESRGPLSGGRHAPCGDPGHGFSLRRGTETPEAAGVGLPGSALSGSPLARSGARARRLRILRLRASGVGHEHHHPQRRCSPDGPVGGPFAPLPSVVGLRGDVAAEVDEPALVETAPLRESPQRVEIGRAARMGRTPAAGALCR